MLGNSGSVKTRYFLFTPSPTPSLHQSRGKPCWQTLRPSGLQHCYHKVGQAGKLLPFTGL